MYLVLGILEEYPGDLEYFYTCPLAIIAAMFLIGAIKVICALIDSSDDDRW